MSEQSGPPIDPKDDCPLPVRVQRRNICCFGAFWGIYYLAAPVSYVGLTHANLCKALGNNDTVSNLPAAIYLWLAFVPVLAAWLFPHPKYLKPMALISIGSMATVTATVAVTLWVGASPAVTTLVVIAHAAVFGAGSGVLLTALWDTLKRGTSTSRRGAAMALAFGVGPLFACVGALLQDAVFDGKLLGGRSFGLQFPHNYTAMFAAVAPLLLTAGIALSLFSLPKLSEPAPNSGSHWAEIATGIGQFLRSRPVRFAVVIYGIVFVVSPFLLAATVLLGLLTLPRTPAPALNPGSPLDEISTGIRQFLRNRYLWCAVVIYVVVYSGGNAIFSNVSLHAKVVLRGEEQTRLDMNAYVTASLQTQPLAAAASSSYFLTVPETDTLGIQSFLRFGCKAVAGGLLGWLLAAASPKATLLATTSVLLIGMGWALNSTGWWFMATFGLLGAGELFGAYFPNYVTTASEKKFVRVNMAYLSVLSAVIGFSSLAFGAISDRYGRIASFYAAAGLLVIALGLICVLLPADPTPPEEIKAG